MKREICCDACMKDWFTPVQPTDAEDAMFLLYEEQNLHPGKKCVSGRARFACVCDGCGKQILQGMECHAVSIFNKETPYFEWESEYINGGERGRE